MRMEKLTAYTDGGSRGGHTAGYGVVITDDENQARRVELNGYIGRATNNEAEYRGLIAALRYAVEHGTKRLKVFMDSELVVRQISGVYTCKAPALRDLYAEAKYLIEKIPNFLIEHVRREFNKEADRLANVAMDEGPAKLAQRRG